MDRLPPPHVDLYYSLIPMLTVLMWEWTLVAMLITWFAQGNPKYVSMDGATAYISDIGADTFKPFFVVSCCTTAVGFVHTVVVERWLTLKQRFTPEMRSWGEVFSVLAILSSVVAGAGLILLSVFDTKRYTTQHRLFLLIFMLGVWFTAAFTVVDFRWLSKDYPFTNKLRHDYKIKGKIAILLALLSIMFGVAMYKAKDWGGCFTMGHRQWIRLLSNVLLLRRQVTEAGEIGQPQPASREQLPSNGVPRSQATWSPTPYVPVTYTIYSLNPCSDIESSRDPASPFFSSQALKDIFAIQE